MEAGPGTEMGGPSIEMVQLHGHCVTVGCKYNRQNEFTYIVATEKLMHTKSVHVLSIVCQLKVVAGALYLKVGGRQSFTFIRCKICIIIPAVTSTSVYFPVIKISAKVFQLVIFLYEYFMEKSCTAAGAQKLMEYVTESIKIIFMQSCVNKY